MSGNSSIKAMRKAHGLTQEQLAKLLGVSRSTVAKYELGSIDPPSKVLGQMAMIFHCSLDDLVDVQEVMHFSSENEAAAFSSAVKTLQTAFLECDNKGQLCDDIFKQFLLDAFNELNRSGQRKAISLLYKLSANPKYQRQPEEGEESAVDPQEND